VKQGNRLLPCAERSSRMNRVGGLYRPAGGGCSARSLPLALLVLGCVGCSQATAMHGASRVHALIRTCAFVPSPTVMEAMLEGTLLPHFGRCPRSPSVRGNSARISSAASSALPMFGYGGLFSRPRRCFPQAEAYRVYT
jgi:hypothetical protein